MKEKDPGSAPTLMGIPMKWVSLLMLVAQTVSVVFFMRLSRVKKTEDGLRYLNTTAVFFSEVLKLICSYLFLSNEKESFSSAAGLAYQHLTRNPAEVLKVTVPSLLYTVQNNLLFISLSNLSGAVYQVTYQLKILTTAVLSVIILGKALGPTKWSALLMLTSGVSLIQFPRGENAGSAQPENGNAAVGLMAVLSACVTSGLAGVYLEKILKQTDASIWLRNIQLALFGAIAAFVGCFITDGAKIQQDGFMQGYNSLVWCVIMLQAVGGLVVAAVLKYADNILKCFGNALSIVLSCLLSWVFLQEFVPDFLFVIGTLLVLMATSMYSLGVPQEIQRFMKELGGARKTVVQSTDSGEKCGTV
jgi:UDP-sugar transporter A1/2/3